MQINDQLQPDSVDPILINTITRDMFDKTYCNIGIVPINYGFVPVDPHGYQTKFAFDASELTLYKLFKWVPDGVPCNPLHLVLKGTLRYVITLEEFRPYDLSVVGVNSDTTSFSISGSIPVNCVLAVGDVDRYSDTEFTIKLCKKKHYISGMDGKIVPFNKFGLFGKLMRNPDVIKNINIPFTVTFVPKPNELFSLMSEDQDLTICDEQVSINEITEPVVDLILDNTIPDTSGFQYKEGIPLVFQTSVDGHTLENVVVVETNPLTLQTQFHIYLVGQIFSNAIVDNLYAISSTTDTAGISFTSPGVVNVNVDLGIVTSEDELLAIVNSEPEVIVNEINIVAVTESGQIIEYDPNNPEAFFLLFDGVSKTTFQIITSVVIVPTPVPFS